MGRSGGFTLRILKLKQGKIKYLTTSIFYAIIAGGWGGKLYIS